MKNSIPVGECAVDTLLADWFARYLMDRDSIIYDDAGLEVPDEVFTARIAALHEAYRSQFEAHGLLRRTPSG